MPDYVLIDGDEVEFEGRFGGATVTVRPGTLRGSGPATVGGKKICVRGDETSVTVEGCPYVTKTHTVSGSGTLVIDALSTDQVASKTKTGGQPVLLVGTHFTARFEVSTPAMDLNSNPDTPTPFSGTGTFVTQNTTLRGT